MERLRIYTDTSVIGGCFDDEFRDASVRLFDKFRQGASVLVISDVTVDELEGAPAAVRRVLDDVPDHAFELIKVTAEVERLARQYIERGVIRPQDLADARHIAAATIHNVDALVSWNFKHIVNLPRIRGYNSINLLFGYKLLEIRTPQEVLPDAEDV